MEAFVARIHLPALTTLRIRFFNQLIFEIPQLYGFISREGLNLFNEVLIIPAEKYVEIPFYRKEKRGYDPGGCHFSIPCRHLNWQLSFTAQIFNQLPPLLSGAKLLIIDKPYLMSTGREDVDPAQWLELFQPLPHRPHLSEVRVDIEELVPDVVHALVNGDMAAGLLPCLTSLHLEGYRKSPSAIDAVERFVATRKLASRNIFLSG
jgi:hypothetical protein